jgi:hypothetical protein
MTTRFTRYYTLLVDGVRLGLLVIELLDGLRKGKERVETIRLASLDRTLLLETHHDPYGLYVHPVE